MDKKDRTYTSFIPESEHVSLVLVMVLVKVVCL